MKTFDKEFLRNHIDAAEPYFIIKEHIERLEELATLSHKLYGLGSSPIVNYKEAQKLDNLYEELFNENI